MAFAATTLCAGITRQEAVNRPRSDHYKTDEPKD
jgi:hypothetical protein